MQLEKDWQYILKDSGSKVVLAANETIYSQVKEYVGKVTLLFTPIISLPIQNAERSLLCILYCCSVSFCFLTLLQNAVSAENSGTY